MSTEPTRLIATAHALRRKPIAALDPEDLRLLIGQDIDLPRLLPLAVGILSADPMVAGHLYEGDLLSAVLTRDRTAWREVPRAARDLRTIVSGPIDLPADLRAKADAFLVAVAGL